MATQNCPKCGKPVDKMVPIDTGLKVALAATQGTKQIPSLVCNDCYAELTSQFSQGLKLRIEKDQREKNKVVMWKNRVNLIKQARSLLAQKAYSEAAVAYEKYLRVLEMVYNLNKGGLTPQVFNNSKRSKELTVVASVYWDLMRIYDLSPRYGERMAQSANKLSQFLPFSPLYPDVTKRAESFARTAKNPNIVRGFLKSVNANTSRCFIATAIVEESEIWQIEVLRQFRDQKLIPSANGRRFVHWYYENSPPLAEWLRHNTWARKTLRPFLRLLAHQAKKSLN